MVRNNVNAPPRDQFVDLLDAEGILVRTFVGYDESFWLDESRIILTTYERGGQGEIEYDYLGFPTAISSIATIGQQPAEIGTSLAGGESNLHGAVAVADCVLCEYEEDNWHGEVGYRIWTDDGQLTDVRPGDATAWSLDGDRLLVEHPLEDGPTRRSTWEILTWPGFDRYARGDGVLDADFTRAARWHSSGESGPTTVTVVDLVNGRKQIFEDPYLGGDATWDSEGRLVLTDYDTGNATAHALDGAVLDRWDRVGNYVSTSADHSTLVFWYWDQLDEPQVLSVLKDTELTSVTTPAPFFVGFDAVHVSPDGSAMVIVCYLAGQERALLFRL